MYSSRRRFQRANQSDEDFLMPAISICIPTYNGADYICQAVKSVLDQQYPDFEIVIVDNCSTDQTPALVKDLLSERGERIRYFRNEQNIGLVRNFNTCLKYACGEYIKFLCVDDILLPDCLALMASEFEKNPSATLVCGGRLIIDSTGNPKELKRYSTRRKLVPGKEAIARCVLGTNFIGEPTAVMFRRHDVTSYFRDDLPQLMDMEMWFRLLEKGDLLNIELPLCAVRVHKAQMSGVNLKSGNLVSDRVKIFEEYGRQSRLELSLIQVVKHKLAMTYRVWVSRAFLSNDNKKKILHRYGIGAAYPFMPLISLALTLTTAVARAMSSWTFKTSLPSVRSFIKE
jgi:glycosyltransferase involved in cell wall biosynthesis